MVSLLRHLVTLTGQVDDVSLAEAAAGVEAGWRWWSSLSRRLGGAVGCEQSSSSSC